MNQSYEIPTALICRRNDTVAPLSICYWELFLSYSLEVSVVYITPFLKDWGYHTYLATTTYLRCLTGFLCSHQACPLLGLRSGASKSSTNFNLDPNILNQHEPQPNVSNRRWYWANNLFPPS